MQEEASTKNTKYTKGSRCGSRTTEKKKFLELAASVSEWLSFHSITLAATIIFYQPQTQ